MSVFTLEAFERPGSLPENAGTRDGLWESMPMLFITDITYLKSEHFFGITHAVSPD